MMMKLPTVLAIWIALASVVLVASAVFPGPAASAPSARVALQFPCPSFTATNTPTRTNTPPTATNTPTSTTIPLFASLAIAQSSVAAGTSLTVSWSGIPNPSTSNWIGLYVLSAAGDGSFVPGGEITLPGTSSGTIAFPIPLGTVPGCYELRLYAQKTTLPRLATSPFFTVTAPTITPSTATRTPTATATPPPGCAPRPNVDVAVTAIGGGRLQVVVAARTNASTPSNLISQLRFAAGPTANALVDVQGQTGLSGTFTVDLVPPVPSVTFVLRQPDAGYTTVPLVVKDACDDWSTFVGGGPAAFAVPDSPAPPTTPLAHSGPGGGSAPDLAPAPVVAAPLAPRGAPMSAPGTTAPGVLLPAVPVAPPWTGTRILPLRPADWWYWWLPRPWQRPLLPPPIPPAWLLPPPPDVDVSAGDE